LFRLRFTLVLHSRPTSAGLHMNWETLTHGDLDEP
jgi:hypothetical protein